MSGDVLRTTPRRVLREAHVRGVHADCIAAGWDDACETCIDTVSDIYRDLYKAKTALELVEQIRSDLKEDRKNSG